MLKVRLLLGKAGTLENRMGRLAEDLRGLCPTASPGSSEPADGPPSLLKAGTSSMGKGTAVASHTSKQNYPSGALPASSSFCNYGLISA